MDASLIVYSRQLSAAKCMMTRAHLWMLTLEAETFAMTTLLLKFAAPWDLSQGMKERMLENVL